MDEELGDEQWELIAPLLPKHKRRGRPRAEYRRTRSAPPTQPVLALPVSRKKSPGLRADSQASAVDNLPCQHYYSLEPTMLFQ
jgi:transposase